MGSVQFNNAFHVFFSLCRFLFFPFCDKNDGVVDDDDGCHFMEIRIFNKVKSRSAHMKSHRAQESEASAN